MDPALTSFLNTPAIMDLQRDTLISLTNSPDPEEEFKFSSMSAWNSLIDSDVEHSLDLELPAQFCAWRRSAASPGTSSWMWSACLHSQGPMSMTAHDFASALRLRLLCPIDGYNFSQYRRCRCSARHEVFYDAGLHGLCFKRSSLRTVRHDSIRDALAAFLRNLHFEVSLEPCYGRQRLDIKVKAGMRTYLLDVSIAHLPSNKYLPASTEPFYLS